LHVEYKCETANTSFMPLSALCLWSGQGGTRHWACDWIIEHRRGSTLGQGRGNCPHP